MTTRYIQGIPKYINSIPEKGYKGIRKKNFFNHFLQGTVPIFPCLLAVGLGPCGAQAR